MQAVCARAPRVDIGGETESCNTGRGRGKKATCAPFASQCNMSCYKWGLCCCLHNEAVAGVHMHNALTSRYQPGALHNNTHWQIAAGLLFKPSTQNPSPIGMWSLTIIKSHISLNKVSRQLVTHHITKMKIHVTFFLWCAKTLIKQTKSHISVRLQKHKHKHMNIWNLWVDFPWSFVFVYSS